MNVVISVRFGPPIEDLAEEDEEVEDFARVDARSLEVVGRGRKCVGGGRFAVLVLVAGVRDEGPVVIEERGVVEAEDTGREEPSLGRRRTVRPPP